MEKRLQYIFGNVSDWLKFAEQKNAGLLVANIAIIVAFSKLISDESITNQILNYYLIEGIILIPVSLLICLLSFIPQVEIPYLARRKTPSGNENLLFYGEIRNLSVNEYVYALQSLCKEENQENNTKLELYKHYANQIIVNSQIAYKKYSFFSLATHFTMCGLLTPILYFPFYFSYKNQREQL